MTKEKTNEISGILSNAKWMITIGLLVILFMPFILINTPIYQRFNFSETGQVGDTIGGITAPFMNLIGAVLVYLALKAQVKANELIQEQIDRDNIEKESEYEAQNLNQLYTYLTENINNFHFQSLPFSKLRNIDFEYTRATFSGGEAFNYLISQIICHYHGTPEELRSNQSISELLSILKIMDLLLEKVENSKSKNKEIIQTLVKHLFEYKISTRLRDESNEQLNVRFCIECNCNHGMPDDLKILIIKIRHKLNLEFN